MATPPPDDRPTDPPPSPSTSKRGEHHYRVAGDAFTFPVALILVAVTAAASMFVPRRWLDLAALVGVAVCALAADLIVRAKARAAAITIGCSLAYVGIVADGDWLNGIAWTLVPFAALAWLTVVIGFRAILKAWRWEGTLDGMQDRRDDGVIADLLARLVEHDDYAMEEGFASVWPRIRSTWRLPNGTRFLGGRRTPRGGRVSVRTAGDSAAVYKSARTIAARVGVPAEAVEVTGDSQDNSVAHININVRDPLDVPAAWSPPQVGRSIRDGARILVDERGRDRVVPLTETHIRVTGVTRSGKTVTLRTVASEVVSCVDAVLIIVDVAKGATELTRLHPQALMVATDYTEAAEAIRWLVDAGKARMAERAKKHVEGTHRPTRGAPQYVLLIDEFAALMKDDTCAAGMEHLLLTGSGWGLTVIAGIVKPHYKLLPTYMRDQMGTRIAHAGEGSDYHKMALDEPPRPGYDASQLRLRSGLAIVRTNESTSSWRARVRYPEPKLLTDWLSDLPERDHINPHPDLPDGPPPTPNAPVDELGDDEPARPRLHVVDDDGPDPDKLNRRDRAVYDAIAALCGNGIRPIKADIARHVGRDPKTVTKALDALTAAGYVIRGDDGSGAVTYRPARTSVAATA